MASVNKVILIGHLGKDPDLRTFPSGDRIANVSLATTETWKDKQTGERRESTEWHRVVFRNGLAGIAEQYLRKGGLIYVEGSIKSRKYTDSAGVERTSVEIFADQMRMLSGRPEAGAAPPARAPAPQGSRAPAPAPGARAGGSSGFDDLDDIPF